MQQNTNVQLQNIVKEHQKLKVKLEQREKDLQEREARNDIVRKLLVLGKNMVITQDLILLSLACLSLDGYTDV